MIIIAFVLMMGICAVALWCLLDLDSVHIMAIILIAFLFLLTLVLLIASIATTVSLVSNLTDGEAYYKIDTYYHYLVEHPEAAAERIGFNAKIYSARTYDNIWFRNIIIPSIYAHYALLEVDISELYDSNQR